MKLTCNYCGNEFERKNYNIKRKCKKYFCSVSCKNKDQSDEYTLFRHMFNRAKRDSKRVGRFFNINLDDLSLIWHRQAGKCNLSGIPLKFGNTDNEKNHGYSTAYLDRIDNNVGYESKNIQIIHKTINFLKKDLPEDLFIYICRQISWHTRDRLINASMDDYEPAPKKPIDKKPVIDYNEIDPTPF